MSYKTTQEVFREYALEYCSNKVLLPCPFCGDIPKYEYSSTDYKDEILFTAMIKCRGCYIAEVKFDTSTLREVVISRVRNQKIKESVMNLTDIITTAWNQRKLLKQLE